MKTNKTLKLALIVLFTVCGFYILAQNPVNWSDKQLMEPATLAATLKAGKNIPTIISVGPGAIIPNSIDIGTMKETANLQKLKDQLSKLPKNTKIVVYCGCCPFEHCPNVRPAIAALKEMKFTNYFLLNIPKNIKTDWIDKGYPVNK
jgi:thiosulfate/3-mercaptopyruvate sulfurtransferase